MSSRPAARTGQKAERKHVALEDDILATGQVKQKAPKRKQRHENEFGDEKYVDSKSSAKVLKISREMVDEEEEEANKAKGENVRNTAFEIEGVRDEDESEEEEEGKFEDETWGDEEEIVEEVEMSPEDLATWRKFNPTMEDDLLTTGGAWGDGQAQEGSGMGGIGESTNLADLILEKIAEAEAKKEKQFMTGAVEEEAFELPPKVVEVYTKIGFLLSRYKSGKLPKPFKILPSVPHWEEIIQLTRPDKWTPNACYEATKIFVSSTPVVAQIFMEHVILERVREDIQETKHLNVHLFKALKKGLYKPAAWFKGFLFPLVGGGMCTLREAHIISGVLARVSIPVLHSAAALKGLCDIAAQETNQETEGGGATNIFIKTLLEKKYALPYQVIDALVFHFLRFREDPNKMQTGRKQEGAGKLPVIWHQCLLSFAQRYRNDITEDQREALLDLLLTKGHSAIGPEVRRELLEGRGRGVVLEPEMPSNGGDDTMMMD